MSFSSIFQQKNAGLLFIIAGKSTKPISISRSIIPLEIISSIIFLVSLAYCCKAYLSPLTKRSSISFFIFLNCIKRSLSHGNNSLAVSRSKYGYSTNISIRKGLNNNVYMD
uniref:Orf c01024 protein n=1 Tax=Saccharolobus solfataricus TaxID=2287 RepID=P95922_SACSO|nr:orf c01024 [Saccharolobus solfataricus P2]